MRPRDLALLTLAMLLTALLTYAQDGADAEEVAPLTPAEIQTQLKQAKEALAAIERSDMEAAGASLGGIPITQDELGGWSEALAARARVLGEMEARKPPPVREDLEKSLSKLDDEREGLSSEATVHPSTEITEDGVAKKTVELEKLKQEEQAATRALEQVRERREGAGALATTVSRRIAEIEEAIGEEAPEGVLPLYLRRTLELELLAARLSLADSRTFGASSEILASIRQREAEIAAEKLRRLEAFVEEARKIIEERNIAEVEAREVEARRLAEAARLEQDPVERFRKKIDADIEQIGADATRDAGWLARIGLLESRQESKNTRLEVLRRRLESRFREGRGVSSRSAELLKSAKIRIEEERELLEGELQPELEAEIDRYLEARAELQDRLWELEETPDGGPGQYREFFEDLPEERREEALKVLAAKRADLKRALGAREKGHFSGIYPELLAVEKTYAARRELLGEVFSEVVRRIYWIQSDRPLGADVLSKVSGELQAVAAALGGAEARAQLDEALQTRSGRLLLALAGIVVLVGVGFLLFRRMRAHAVDRYGRGGRVLGRVQRFLEAVVVSALAPICLIAAGLLVGFMDLPASYERLGSGLLFGLAGILFLRRMARALFRDTGFIVEELGASEEIARQLRKFFQWAALGLLFLWLPWWLLKKQVFELNHIPRLIYTVMLVFFALLLLTLMRPRGAVMKRVTAHPGIWHRIWSFLYLVVVLGFVAVIVMEVYGYRLGAGLLVSNVLETFCAAFALFGLYHLITGIFRQALPRMANRWWAAESSANTRRLTESVAARITGFAGIAAVILGVVLLAGFWGVDEQVQELMESVKLRTVDAGNEVYLTLWDVLMAVVWVLGAHFVVRNIAAVFEATLFTRIEASDPGSRYVVITLSKYVILLVGYSAAFTSLHVSFQSLGWLLAAASVGLGFGLREIVANFVSGLILFVERPIKVGDFVTVGGTLGTVEKISIRATQVLSRDRKVIIIPNRLFISEQVVNWSHNDDVVRITISVGIAYGTDVEKARKILLEIVEKNPLVRRNPPPQALLLTFGESSLDIQLRIFTTIRNRRRAEDQINSEITRRFQAEGIEIPFPQRDLNVRSALGKEVIETLHEASKKDED